MDAGRAKAYLRAQGYLSVTNVQIAGTDPLTWTIDFEPFTPLGERTAALSRLRAATQATIEAALIETDASELFAQKAMKATVVWVLRRILGRAPTPAEITAARDEWIAVFRSL